MRRGRSTPSLRTCLPKKGSLFLTRPTLYHYVVEREELEQAAKELFDVVTSGKVKIEVKQSFALKDAAEAHRALEARKTQGRRSLRSERRLPIFRLSR